MKAPTVIATIPAGLGSVEVCVRHHDHGIEVDVRPAGTRQSWRPLSMVDGTFEVRDEVTS